MGGGTGSGPARLTGTVTGCWIVLGEGVESTSREMLTLNSRGIVYDRHSGHTRHSGAREVPFYPKGTEIRNDRQVSLVSGEELKLIAEDMGLGVVTPEWLGANLRISGIPVLSRLPPTARLRFSRGAVLVVHHENYPCPGPGKVIAAHYPDRERVVPDFVKAAKGRRGLVGWVECPGEIWLGDTVEVFALDEIIK